MIKKQPDNDIVNFLDDPDSASVKYKQEITDQKGNSGRKELLKCH